jgi:hypothetical protein
MSAADPDPAAATAAAYERTYAALVARAQRDLNRGRWNRAAVMAELAADYLSQHHAGRFSDPRLERMLIEVGKHVIPAGDAAPDPTAPGWPRSVLHVLTYASAIGGHTRLAARWIEVDEERTHTVVLTGRPDVPPDLERVAVASGGVVNVPAGDLIERARALAAAAAGVDLVVLHTHPSDVVPVIALGGLQPRPRVLVLNHADHQFWLGVAVGDVIVNLRPMAVEMTVSRRGVAPERSGHLPIPIPAIAPPERPDRGGAVRLVSVGSDWKFVHAGLGLFDLVRPTLERHPHVELTVIGPRPEGEWARIEAETGGRVRAVGARNGVRESLAEADIYLDSYPMPSFTALLEAGLARLPLLHLRAPVASTSFMNEPDDLALAEAMLVAETPAAYTELLDRLVEDAAFRTETGDRARRIVADVHCPPGWLERLEAVYARAGELDPVDGDGVDAPRRFDQDDREALRTIQSQNDRARYLHSVADICGRRGGVAGRALWLQTAWMTQGPGVAGALVREGRYYDQTFREARTPADRR